MKISKQKTISVPETLEIKVFEAVKVDDRISEGFVRVQEKYPLVLDLPNRFTSFGEYFVKEQDLVSINRSPRAPDTKVLDIQKTEAIF